MKAEDPKMAEEAKNPERGEAEEGALERARQRLRGVRGSAFWERLEQLAEEADFQKLLQRLAPQIGWRSCEGVDRRRFLQLMGAALGMAGLTACTKQPPEYIVPYINQPPELTPGLPLYFTSAMELGGEAYGLVVTSREGRPIKIDGNPRHPGSLGATDVFGQAELLRLYDPDRAQTVLQFGKVSTWDDFYLTLVTELRGKRAAKGAGVRLLTPGVSSPTQARLIGEFLKAYPAAAWHRWEPVSHDNARVGARLALGADLQPIYDFTKAETILSLDSDFLAWEPGHLNYALKFIDGRRVREGRTAMNRLYVAEPSPTITGAKADHHLAIKPSQLETLARALAAKLGVETPVDGGELPEAANGWLNAALTDLRRKPGAGLVLAGAGQPPAVHALALAINQALGSVGQTVQFIDPLEAGPPDAAESLRQLTQEMTAGQVDVLFILGGNPAYDAPTDIPFAEAMEKVRLRVRLGLYEDETSLRCQWHLPETHFLEAWGDARAYDGTATLSQPLIMPIYAGRSAIELLAMMLEQPTPTGRELVRATWRTRLQGRNFEQAWEAALSDGFIAGTAAPRRNAQVKPGALAQLAVAPAPKGAAAGGLELVFRPDYAVYDGRYANNSWLQEIPRPLSKISWDNAALMSAATARGLGVSYMDVVELNLGGRTVQAPVWIEPGCADGCVTAHLGYGRSAAGRVGNGVGFNAYTLRTAAAPWCGRGLQARKVKGRWEIATIRAERTMAGRDEDIVRHAPIEEFRKRPEMFHAPTQGGKAAHGDQAAGAPKQAPKAQHPSLYPQYPYPSYAWGMAIDTNACIGCNACIAACVAENNIATVGKGQVIVGREMLWLRVDRYYTAGEDLAGTLFAPIPCMHCETAPCEVVCPVGATVHSDEGLNEMVYNRCVGTRYCSNNCPYKVRRFNFLKYQDMESLPLKLMRNPEVTVRVRGVMEKCTYCVQRITLGRIEAEKRGTPLRDGEVMTACQMACPTRTIVFGDLNDPQSEVAGLARQPQAYGMLSELNTRPRTRYLAHFENPNPELKKKV